MSKTVKLLSLFVLLLLTFSIFLPGVDTAFAVFTIDTVYVNGTTGSDLYSGSSPTFVSGIIGPKKTIIGGVNVVSTNGTVYVAAGTYHENNIHLSDSMNLVGAGALTTIIDGTVFPDGVGGDTPVMTGTVIIVSSLPYQRNTISGFTIQNGGASYFSSGGGIWVSSSHIVTINDCAIINNTKLGGQPAQGVGTSSNNPGWGAGVCNAGGTVYMNRCTVSGNTATYGGGGIYTGLSGFATSGMGVEPSFGLVELSNCTISGNTVTGNGSIGGGICCAFGSMSLLNVTLANNRATGLLSAGGGCSSGGAISSSGGFSASNGGANPIYFKNCIVANNTSTLSDYNNLYNSLGGGTYSQGNNIDSESKAVSHYLNDPTDRWNTNPSLGALQNNGGQTSTHAITSSSPAFNSGNNTGAPATDQRGVARPQAITCDIGAYELELSKTASVATATGTGTAAVTTGDGAITSLTASTSLQCGTPPALNFPHGFFNFTINYLTVGSTVTITITLPSAMPVGTQYWKCINGQWLNVTSILGDNDGDNVLTLTIKDGGFGDADGVANGTIVDPGGPAILININNQQEKIPLFRQDSVSPQMVPKMPARCSVKYLDVQPRTAAISQPVTIMANMTNGGDESGAYTATLKINGIIEQTKTGTVGGRAVHPLSFTVSKNKPGTYQVDINGQVSSFTVAGESQNNSVNGTAQALYLLLALMILAVIVLAILVVRRQQE